MGGATGEIFIMSIQPRIYISSKIYVDINGVIAVKNKYNVKNIVYNCLDPVIVSHSGPGTLAVFFMGKER